MPGAPHNLQPHCIGERRILAGMLAGPGVAVVEVAKGETSWTVTEPWKSTVITPVPFAAGMVNALSWATRRPDGFTAAHLRLLDELLPAYSAAAESKALIRFTENGRRLRRCGGSTIG